MTQPYIEVTVCASRYDSPKTVRVAMDETDMRELTQGWEISEEPISLLLESFGRRGGVDEFVKMRRRAVQFRGDVADKCMSRIRSALMEAFAENDTENGYRKEDLQS